MCKQCTLGNHEGCTRRTHYGDNSPKCECKHKRKGKHKHKKHIKVYIHDLWWTDLVTVKVKVPKRFRWRGRFRAAWAAGVAAGVAASLSTLEVKSSSALPQEDING